MKKKSKLFNIFIYLCLVIFALSILVPVFWVFMASIKTNPEFYGNPWALPMSFYLNNFKDAWAAANMGDYFLNSLIVTAIALALLLLISLPFSYILARMQFKGRRFVTSYIKAGLFINLSYIVIPIFLMLRDVSKSIPLALLNNRFVLALIYASTAVPFTVYLLTNFFSSISKSYEEAAYIDGAGYYRTMMDIMIPMARPAVITVILFNFLSFWNEYILALTLMTDPSKRTLPVGLINLQQAARGAANYGRLYAGLVIVMIPTLIIYILVQKQLTEGMMVGGDKG
ncbi:MULTISPECIES: carbohydrate ABC transporter permease [Anaerococcus]|uniref:ABC transporter, permease protein n=2 Tax=Anaerococcus vaginalis TaxID=33037 RepID=C7HV90_9FIRM|nr:MULTISPECIES: carbohydrate ABC transporter permease [Anaerococcus]EEU12402.1 ABC transporter, permease protein [Anaerococcus vaginalis ATCC 51170]MBS6920964.1 carbohydrate ABC transporter permease [Anaerococcus vaginalis]MDD7766179.1 carbohydrate ABC transporter permease [Anaerococcus vaginalis]MDU0945684.1 carbohydrate ABC transporter permease [Anaerococcus vaginalis]MDU1030362.1 carbohydrate ABC transporter permease [Anaerococcus vaginalis]